MAIDLKTPPSIPAYFRFWAEKWSHEYARNALLHYIASKGLSEDCDLWLEKESPSDGAEVRLSKAEYDALRDGYAIVKCHCGSEAKVYSCIGDPSPCKVCGCYQRDSSAIADCIVEKRKQYPFLKWVEAFIDRLQGCWKLTAVVKPRVRPRVRPKKRYQVDFPKNVEKSVASVPVFHRKS